MFRGGKNVPAESCSARGTRSDWRFGNRHILHFLSHSFREETFRSKVVIEFHIEILVLRSDALGARRRREIIGGRVPRLCLHSPMVFLR